MTHLRLAAALDAAGLPTRQALAAAAKLGVAAAQADAAGDLNPDRLTDTGRREFRTLLRSFGLELAAVRLPLRRGLDAAEDQDRRVDHVKKVLRLAVDLGTPAVVAPMPRVPADPADPRAVVLRDVLLDLGRVGDRVGARLCLEAGLDPGDKVRDYLGGFDTGGLAVTADPANFLVNGHDPLGAIAALGPLVGYVQARDARTATASAPAREVAVGAGDIEWLAFVATLEAIGYRGFVTVDREDGPDRWADVGVGVGVLRRFVGPGERPA